ncbi:hypothetical protein JCM10212_000810 [Sporobolomyces blumeae]
MPRGYAAQIAIIVHGSALVHERLLASVDCRHERSRSTFVLFLRTCYDPKRSTNHFEMSPLSRPPASYWPAYSAATQPVSEFPWKDNDMAYYFVTVTTSGGFEIGPGQNVSDVKRFTSLARKHGVQSLFSIRGWDGSQYFSDLVSTEKKRARFAKQIKAFVDENGFDGVDLDWEYPNSEGIGCNSIRSTDSANFLAFLKTLHDLLEGAKKALITAAVATTPFNDADGVPLADVSDFATYLKYINLMTYDISGSWSATTGPNSPLRACGSDSSVVNAVKAWTSAGFPASQILVGLPAYAHSFTTNGIPKGDSEDVVPITDSCNVTTTTYAGSWQYHELIDEGFLSADGKRGLHGWKRYFDECAATPFLYNSATKYFISYDDQESALAKTDYARKEGLAGVFLFDSTGFKDSPWILKSIRKHLGPFARSVRSTSQQVCR